MCYIKLGVQLQFAEVRKMASYNEILVLTRINKLAEEDVSKSISGFKLIKEDFKFVKETNISNESVILYNTLE